MADLQVVLQRSQLSIDEPDEAGHTPLQLASDWPYGISLLLSHGADLEKTDRYGHKPVVFAMIHGCTEVVRQLLRAGCSFDLAKCYEGSIRDNVFAFAVRRLFIRGLRLPISKSRNDCF